MLTAIFGAGASADSDPSRPFRQAEDPPSQDQDNDRPPLANELFANRTQFAAVLQRFPQCNPIVPRLRFLLGDSIESVFERRETRPPAVARHSNAPAS